MRLACKGRDKVGVGCLQGARGGGGGGVGYGLGAEGGREKQNQADGGSNGLRFQSYMQCCCEGTRIYGKTRLQKLDGDVHDVA